MFLGVTFLVIVVWLLVCVGVRYGGTRWFRVRWWISRLDVCFATSHWLVIIIIFFNFKFFFGSGVRGLVWVGFGLKLNQELELRFLNF